MLINRATYGSGSTRGHLARAFPKARRSLAASAAAAVAGLMLAATAHAGWHVTAFGDTPGFEEIMAEDYSGATSMLESRYHGMDGYASLANLCVASIKLARTEEAMKSCDRALDAVPTPLSLLVPGYRRADILTHLYSNRGVVRALEGDMYGARVDFEYALKIDPKNGNARRNLEEVSGREVAVLGD